MTCMAKSKLRRYLLCIRTKDFVIVGYHETFLYSGIGGPGAVQLQKSAKAPRPCAWGVRPPGPHLRASARSDRTAREHEALMARNMMSNHIDMQDKVLWSPLRHSPYSKPIQRKPQKRWRGRRPRHLFCGCGQRPQSLYIGFE